jgi:hypothetical protein
VMGRRTEKAVMRSGRCKVVIVFDFWVGKDLSGELVFGIRRWLGQRK